ncbi:MAG TPA: hypothetical protein VEG30_11775 [Terriglobales bacterium]|nr:hypothetical protein [Terriglobales bacterium]
MKPALKAVIVIAIVSIAVALLAQSTPQTVPVRTVIRVESKEPTPPELSRQDVMVRQGKDRLQVTGLISAKAGSAASGLDLYILIDDGTQTSLGLHLDELREFITSQPANTQVAVGYMRNGTVNVAQALTTDHAAAAKSIRLPLGYVGAGGSPYLSLMSLLKQWPGQNARRAILMVSDGIDRFRGDFGPLAPFSPDLYTASDLAQRAGVEIYSIFFRSGGHLGHNYWELNRGQNSLAKLAEDTAGESFYLGLDNPVDFQPYLKEMQTDLENQYILAFLAKPKPKAGLQRVKIFTEVPKVEIVAPNGVWVPAMVR